MNKIIVFLIFILIMSFANLTIADTIFETGAPGNAAVLSDLGSDYQTRVGDTFTLSESYYLEDIHWWGEGLSNFTYELYEFVGGNPINPLQLNPTSFGYDPYHDIRYADIYNQYWVDIEPILLEPGTYLLSIYADSSGAEDNWFWAATFGEDDEDGAYFINQITEEWELIDWPIPGEVRDMAFYLTGTSSQLPESSTLLLLCTGLGALGLVSFRRKRK